MKQSTLTRLFWKVATAAKWCFTVLLVCFGLVEILVGIIAILDPAGTKLADDNDPFGTPPAIWQSTLQLLFFVGLTVGAVLFPRFVSKLTNGNA